jgi:hypothetical protein
MMRFQVEQGMLAALEIAWMSCYLLGLPRLKHARAAKKPLATIVFGVTAINFGMMNFREGVLPEY